MYCSEQKFTHEGKSIILKAFLHEGIHYITAQPDTPLEGPWSIPILGTFAQFKSNVGMVAEQLCQYLFGVGCDQTYENRVDGLKMEIRNMARIYWVNQIPGRPFDSPEE